MIQAASLRPAVPADGLLHPVAVGALALLVVNDHWLKGAWPGAMTGKLSDVAGLVLAPLVAQAACEVTLWVARRPWGPSWRVLVLATALVAVGFALAKLGPLAEAYRWGLGFAQFLAAAAVSAVTGSEPAVLMPVALAEDATDLMALPACLVPLWLGRARARRH